MSACAKCGKEITAEANFCKACGSRARDEKKARVLAGERKSPRTAIIVGAAIAVIVAGWMIYSTTSRARSMDGPMKASASREGNRTMQYRTVAAENGDVKVALNLLQGNEAAYFVYNAGGKDIKFFVLKATDGSVRAALDSCTSCYHAKLGYRQDGDTMICNNCGMGFKSTDVGHIRGGCSPIPLQNGQDGKTLTVKVKDLEEGAKYF